MAQCLLDISDDSESKSLLDLQRYSLEMAGCFVCCWMTTAHKAAAAECLSIRDDLCPLQQESLPNKLYEDLLVNTSCNACPVAAALLPCCYHMPGAGVTGPVPASIYRVSAIEKTCSNQLAKKRRVMHCFCAKLLLCEAGNTSMQGVSAISA